LFDAWCRELIIGEVFKFYEGYSRGREVELERVRPYRDYIAWLGEQNLSAAEEFWREELKGVTGPTYLGIEQGAEIEEGEYSKKDIWLSEETSRRLEEVARSMGGGDEPVQQTKGRGLRDDVVGKRRRDERDRGDGGLVYQRAAGESGGQRRRAGKGLDEEAARAAEQSARV
jgi:hypothetical protein